MLPAMRRFLAAVAFLAGLLPSLAAWGQACPAVAALPDSERRTSYALSSSTCPACSVGFQLYGTGTDYGNWIEVILVSAAGVQTRLTAVSDYTLSSASGPLSTICRPITNATITLTTARTGYVLAPTSTPVGTRWAQADEYAGGYALLVSGGTTYPLLLEGNTGGVWRATGGAPQLVLMIDRDTDLTGIPSSGTLHIIPPLFVALYHANQTTFRSFRLRITAQDTSENYFKMRPPILGSLMVFGRQNERGRLVGPRLSEEVSEIRGGARRVRALTRPRRYVELAWTSLLVGGGTGGTLGAASPDPSYLAISGGTAVAASRDPAMIEAILQVARGGQQPLVYLPSILTGSSTTQISARELILPGRITGEGGARTGVMGDENSTEAVTLGTLRIEEMP